ncbi:MAG TPA: ABC transporter ATP-binding protein [Chloroflexota bacterium]|nr:ABC transporter ATP-binding protein [Chloroflexota bacterium]
MAEERPILRMEGVSYSYMGRYPALVGVDLSVARGERLVILGANGCGKSTLLKIADGLIRPDAGRAETCGEDASAAVDDLAVAHRLHRQVGLVFQDADVQLFSPTVWDDVAFGPLQMGWDDGEVRRRVESALELMGIEALARRAPYELSEGEKKRASIATVLSLDPDLLLLDEPTANLDPRSKGVLVELIARLADEGKTVVTTTQELEIAPEVGRRALVFGYSERRQVAEGPVLRVLDDTDLLVRANLIHPRLLWRR